MNGIEISFDVVAILVIVIAALFAFAGVQFKSNQNKNDLEEFKKTVHEKFMSIDRNTTRFEGEIKKELSDISKSLARLEGRQSALKQE